MVVLLVLLVLTNLWFGLVNSFSYAQDPAMNAFGVLDSSTPPYTPDPTTNVFEYLDSIKKSEEERKKRCEKISSTLYKIASKRKWIRSDGKIVLSKGAEAYKMDDCKIRAYVQVGTLDPPKEKSAGTLAPGMLTMKDFTFKVDVSLFRTLFRMLMYAAGIFWTVRAAQKLIAGELTETLITFFIGFIIVASMYVLYRWMPPA
jgi:hypothetical protein